MGNDLYGVSAQLSTHILRGEIDAELQILDV